MSYWVLSLFSVLIFAFIHLGAKKTRYFEQLSHGRFLSMGGGVAIAYIFVDLLPKLSESDRIVREAFSGVFPYFEKHVYVIALIGFLLFYLVDRSQNFLEKKRYFFLSLTSYTLFNFLVGYAVSDQNDPEVQPLALFTLAIGLHYFVNDFELSERHGEYYKKFGKWILIFALFLGWLTGQMFVLSKTAVSLVSAFIGGGVIMNVTRHELPKRTQHSLIAFILAAIFYTIILLAIGT